MLGFGKKEPFVINEPQASQIREKLKRWHNGEFTDEEKEQIKRSKEISSKYHAVWKDENGKIIYEDPS